MSTHAVSSDAKVFRPTALFKAPRQGLGDMILEWRRRIRSRRELAALTQRELGDLGFPAGVADEIHKPFWRM